MVIERVITLKLQGEQTPAALLAAVLKQTDDRQLWHIDWARFYNSKNTAYNVEPTSKAVKELAVPIYRIESEA